MATKSAVGTVGLLRRCSVLGTRGCAKQVLFAIPTHQSTSLRRFATGSRQCSPGATAAATHNNTPDDASAQDQALHAKIANAKAELIQQGFHGPSIWIQTICWGDHDQFQHVNNVHYVRFLESNRMLFAEKLAHKLSPERQKDILRGTGQSFILQGISVRYRRPVVYPDTLLIAKKPALPLGKDRFTLQATVYSLAQQATVATAEETCVSYDYAKLTKIDLPEDFRQALEATDANPAA